MKWLFTKKVWERFNKKLLSYLFTSSRLRYDFGKGKRDVKEVCKYWKEPRVLDELELLVLDNNLIGKDEDQTMKNIMSWVMKEYPSRKYYSVDKREKWNHPLETLESWEERKKGRESSITTDCDDYAIFLYSLARVADVPANKLWLCFMKTSTEWHLNLMYFGKDGVPYAVEGTYYPAQAKKFFLRVPYHNVYVHAKQGKNHYYRFVRWRFNENEVQRRVGKLNPQR